MFGGRALDHLPAGEHDDHRDEAVKDYEEHRDPIHAEVIIDVEARNPGGEFNKLHGRCRHVKTRIERKSDDEAGNRS